MNYLSWPMQRSRRLVACLLVIILSSHAVHLPLLLGVTGPLEISSQPLHTTQSLTKPTITEAIQAASSPSRHPSQQDEAPADAATTSEVCVFEAICVRGRGLPAPIFVVLVALVLPSFSSAFRNRIVPGLALALTGQRRRAWLQVDLN
ncbi:MAG TPA: hypothetical protein VHL09_12140 [Dehalococcoidia bacterium]|nr:hypothetical protein [Dehalococcoidia bacterium]